MTSFYSNDVEIQLRIGFNIFMFRRNELEVQLQAMK